jgi:hypothetical protein
MGVFSYLFNKKKPLKWTFPLPTTDTFSKPKDACSLYFDKLNEIREHNKGKNYFLLIYTCIESINLLPKMVRGWKQESGGSFDIDSIPALEIGCKYLAVLQHKEHLDAIKLILSEVKDLKEWLDYVDYTYSLMELSEKVMTFLKQQPGTMQNSLGQSLGVSGQETKTIVDILEKLNLVQRKKTGKTYALQMVNF